MSGEGWQLNPTEAQLKYHTCLNSNLKVCAAESRAKIQILFIRSFWQAEHWNICSGILEVPDLLSYDNVIDMHTGLV